MSRRERHRVWLDFDAPSFTRLERLRRTIGASSLLAVIRLALVLTEWIVTHQDAGFRLRIVKDGEARDVEFTLVSGEALLVGRQP